MRKSKTMRDWNRSSGASNTSGRGKTARACYGAKSEKMAGPRGSTCGANDHSVYGHTNRQRPTAYDKHPISASLHMRRSRATGFGQRGARNPRRVATQRILEREYRGSTASANMSGWPLFPFLTYTHLGHCQPASGAHLHRPGTPDPHGTD